MVSEIRTGFMFLVSNLLINQLQRFIKAMKSLNVFLKQRKKAYIGFYVVVVIIFISIIGPSIVPYDPFAIEVGPYLEGPSLKHWMGTDVLGRDVLSRIIYGTRISFSISLTILFYSGITGIFFGIISGYYGGWRDRIIMQVCDILRTLPWLILSIAIAAIIGPGKDVVIIALSITNFVPLCRLVRSVVLSIRDKEFIEGAIVSGENAGSILWRYILPNIVSPIIVQSTYIISITILSESAISYLGLGTEPPIPSWGLMLSESQNYFWVSPYLSIFPGIAITIYVLAFNLLGDGLRDILDPKTEEAILRV